MEDFARVTEYLGGSNYTTISLMYSLLAIISKKIISENSDIEVINLTSPNTIFDDDIDYLPIALNHIQVYHNALAHHEVTALFSHYAVMLN